jgi:hypothetical protein
MKHLENVMGKIILEFDSYEEAHEAKLAMQGVDWKNVVRSLDNELREVVKYGGSMIEQGEASETEIDMAQKVRDLLRELMSENNLSLE